MSPTPDDLFGQMGAESSPQSGVPALDDDILSLLIQENVPGTGTYELGEDGEMRPVLPDDDYLPAASSDEFSANLADVMDERAMDKISQDLLDAIDNDIESRGPWTDRFQRGFEMLGITESEMDDGPFPGSCSSVMPVLSEAIVQFWARALAELVPSDGPAKGQTKGKSSKANDARARRVAEYINHDMMFLDRSWYSDMSRMLFALPFTGSTFKKVYRDYEQGRNTSVFVQAEDFICNYAFSDLESAPRYTHRIWRTRNEILKCQVAGIYRRVELQAPSLEELSEETKIRIEASDFEADTNAQGDIRHELYEVYCELVLEGDEREDGVARPYTITIDRSSGKVLAIYRAWREQDPLERRRSVFVKYDYLPGPGFYGLGLLHMIGGLQDAATGALRAILDGAATASLQGGFMSADAAMREQNLVIEPGVWKKVDATAEQLSNAFFTPPFKEPSPVLFQIMGYIVQRAEKFAATTEMMTGSENSKNMPVGSTLAMIEQGGKVFSTIHRGLHKMLGEELRMRFELVQEYAPPEGYPYDVEGAHEGILSEDFAPGVSVVPVSDPNIFSQAQRIALNQAVYDLAQQNPDIIQRPAAVRRVLEGLNVPDIEELLVQTAPPPPMGPVSEVQALLRGEPVQAYPDQDHVSHIQHLAAFANNPQFGANPQVTQQVGPALMALMGQHLAYAWATHARALGVPEDMMPPVMGDGREQMQGGMPPAGPQQQIGPPQGQMQQMQQMPQVPPPQDGSAPPEVIAQIAAQIAPQMAQAPGLPAPDAQAQAEKAQAETAKMQADLKKAEIDQQKSMLDISLKQAEGEHRQREFQLKEVATQQDLALRAKDVNLKEIDIEMKRQEAIKKDEERAAKRMAEEQKAQAEAEKERMNILREAQKAEQEEARHQQAMAIEEQRVQTEREMARVKAAIMASEAEDKKEQRKRETEIKKTQAERQSTEAAKKTDASGSSDHLSAALSVIEGLSKSMSAPKRIVRDAEGRATGVESYDPEGSETSKPKSKSKKGK